MAPSLPGRGEVNFLQKKAFCKRDLSGKFSFRDQEPRRLKDDDAEDDESHGEYAGMQPFFSLDQFSGAWKKFSFFDKVQVQPKTQAMHEVLFDFHFEYHSVKRWRK